MKKYSFVFLIAMMALATSAYAADLTINSMADITNNCPYNTASATYSCTGWDNIYITADLGLPGSAVQNIIFKVNNEFSAKNFYATNGIGRGGSINIEAKKITAASLNTQGTMCKSSACTSEGPFCSNSNGGDVTLKADNVNVGAINTNSGGGTLNGYGGKVSITASSTTVTNIYSSGGDYGGCHYGYGGAGGTVQVKAGSSTINSISVNGGYNGPWYVGGKAAGSVKLSSNTMNLGTINADGSTGSQYGQGAGGNIKIYNDAYTLSSISASGPGGYIAFFTDSAYPTAGTSAPAVVYNFGGSSNSPYSTTLYSWCARSSCTTSGGYGVPCSTDYQCNTYLVDHPNADEIPCGSRYGGGTCEGGGCGSPYAMDTCKKGDVCGEGASGGGSGNLFIGPYVAGKCCPAATPYYNSADGKCYQVKAGMMVPALSASTTKTGKRTGGGFFGFQTSLPLAYKSYSLSIKDALSGTPVQTKYGTNYSQDGSLSNGLLKTFVGRITPINLKLGNDYLLRINGSNESAFNGANCGVKAACKDYDIPFAEY